MSEQSPSPTEPEVPVRDHDAEVQSIIESAQRLGIEVDEAATLQWLAAMAADDDDDVVHSDSGAFGHKVAMLDFSPRDLERFRRIGRIVEVTGPEGIVESALALSGSAAQSKIQSFPGDADYFQRLNIKAPTREEACTLMGTLMREKVLATTHGEGYQFLEAKLGSYPAACTHRGESRKKGSPISWSLEEVQAGVVAFETDEGVETLSWADAALDPGWCKLDWVVIDPERKQLSNASNVIDVTWEAPDGNIVPLDGYLDAYFQEVYLDAESVPVFAKVAQYVSDDALDDYVDRLQEEASKYLTHELNYGKAAKRMYNVFRLSGFHLEAAFLRELFDEPATILYQVWSLISTLDNATQPGSTIPISAVQLQADTLVIDVVGALEGAEETEIVTALLQLRRALEGQRDGERAVAAVEAAQSRVINVVNTFYRDKLMAMPSIRDYIVKIQESAGMTA